MLFSGGEWIWFGFVVMLFVELVVLMMDELINNFDVEGCMVIVELFVGWNGGVLVVSYDCVLFEGVDCIVEFLLIGVISFGGGWSGFVVVCEVGIECVVVEFDWA